MRKHLNKFDSALPLVSIITITLNEEDTIEKTINSVLKQTYSNIEYILIDGGSLDNTIEIINHYEKDISHFVSEQDDGVMDAFNKGLALCSGEIIGIINGNDYYSVQAVERVVANYKKYGDGVFYFGDCVLINKDGSVGGVSRVTNKESFFFMKSGLSIPFPSVFVPRAIYKKCGNFDLQYSIAGDYDFLYRLVKIYKIDFIYIREELSFFRDGGISSNIPKTSRECHLVRINNGANKFESKMYFVKTIVFYYLSMTLTYLKADFVLSFYRKYIIKTHKQRAE